MAIAINPDVRELDFSDNVKVSKFMQDFSDFRSKKWITYRPVNAPSPSSPFVGGTRQFIINMGTGHILDTLYSGLWYTLRLTNYSELAIWPVEASLPRTSAAWIESVTFQHSNVAAHIDERLADYDAVNAFFTPAREIDSMKQTFFHIGNTEHIDSTPFNAMENDDPFGKLMPVGALSTGRYSHMTVSFFIPLCRLSTIFNSGKYFFPSLLRGNGEMTLSIRSVHNKLTEIFGGGNSSMTVYSGLTHDDKQWDTDDEGLRWNVEMTSMKLITLNLDNAFLTKEYNAFIASGRKFIRSFKGYNYQFVQLKNGYNRIEIANTHQSISHIVLAFQSSYTVRANGRPTRTIANQMFFTHKTKYADEDEVVKNNSEGKYVRTSANYQTNHEHDDLDHDHFDGHVIIDHNAHHDDDDDDGPSGGPTASNNKRKKVYKKTHAKGKSMGGSVHQSSLLHKLTHISTNTVKKTLKSAAAVSGKLAELVPGKPGLFLNAINTGATLANEILPETTDDKPAPKAQTNKETTESVTKHATVTVDTRPGTAAKEFNFSDEDVEVMGTFFQIMRDAKAFDNLDVFKNHNGTVWSAKHWVSSFMSIKNNNTEFAQSWQKIISRNMTAYAKVANFSNAELGFLAYLTGVRNMEAQTLKVFIDKLQEDNNFDNTVYGKLVAEAIKLHGQDIHSLFVLTPQQIEEKFATLETGLNDIAAAIGGGDFDNIKLAARLHKEISSWHTYHVHMVPGEAKQAYDLGMHSIGKLQVYRGTGNGETVFSEPINEDMFYHISREAMGDSAEDHPYFSYDSFRRDGAIVVISLNTFMRDAHREFWDGFSTNRVADRLYVEFNIDEFHVPMLTAMAPWYYDLGYNDIDRNLVCKVFTVYDNIYYIDRNNNLNVSDTLLPLQEGRSPISE